MSNSNRDMARCWLYKKATMAKTKEELREARKQWFAQMEQKLQEMHTKEDDSLF